MVTTFTVLVLAARDDSRLFMTLQHTVHCSVNHDKPNAVIANSLDVDT